MEHFHNIGRAKEIAMKILGDIFLIIQIGLKWNGIFANAFHIPFLPLPGIFTDISLSIFLALHEMYVVLHWVVLTKITYSFFTLVDHNFRIMK